jgi:Asp-tRNA(Asn)/Glu-tRNA(Gln) amidotransferase A subunit family amidase
LSPAFAEKQHDMDELLSLPMTQALRRMESGELTAEQLTTSYLDRVSAHDPRIGAWAFVDPERALEQARITDRGPWRGKLHGIPVGIKDVIDTAEFPTEYNSPIYRGHRPTADAACVALLKRAGAIVLGKTVTTEFANITAAKTRNPRNIAHTPGGSSSGSAAAVADNMVPLALGTQTAGSVIRPASYCGVLALKPTFGSINRTGVKPLSEALDTVGIFARCADDLGLVFEVLSGRKYLDLEVTAPRIGLCRTERWLEASKDARTNFELAARILERAGAVIKDFDLPQGANELVDRHSQIMGFESARALAWEYDNFRAKLSVPLAARLETGWQVPLAEYLTARALAGSTRQQIENDIATVDFLLTPSSAGEAPSSIESTGDSKFNRAWTALGFPCINLPFGQGNHGLPLGLQLVGSGEADMTLIAWAKWVAGTLDANSRAPLS